MISRIVLKNFQCHKSLALELGRITVLVGDNDAGKSAVVRALEWVCLNQWDGRAGEQITWGEEECCVEVGCEKNVISRIRSKSLNEYVVNGNRLGTPGVSVPEAASKLLRLNRDNFQTQHSPAFWLTLPAGQAASALNELFCLSAIDDALAASASEIRSTKSRAGVIKERLDSAEKAVRESEWVDGAVGDLEVMEGLALRLEEAGLEGRRLNALYTKMEWAEDFNKDVGGLVLLGEEVLSFINALLGCEEEIKTLKKVLYLKGEICRLEKEIRRAEKALAESLAGKCPLCQRPGPR